MTHAARTQPIRLWLLAATTLAVVLALTVATPASSLAQTGFEPEGPGFVEPAPSDTGTGTPSSGQTPPVGGSSQSAPVGGVQAGLGGAAGETVGLGAPHATAAALLVLVTGGLLAQRRRVTA